MQLCIEKYYSKIILNACFHSFDNYKTKQNRSTEGCSKLKRSVDMTSSGKNGLNIRKNASPKWDRTKCKSQIGQDQMFGGVSGLCWLAAPVAMFYGNLQNLTIRSNSVIKSSIQ